MDETDLPELMGLDQLEEFLTQQGHHRARSTLSLACRDGELGGRKIGGGRGDWVITKSEALAYLEGLKAKDS